MSERGSFVTEYIHCPKCFENVSKELLGNDKYLCSRILPFWGASQGSMRELPIIAGKIGGSYCGDELNYFTEEKARELKDAVCFECEVRIAVLCDAREYSAILVVRSDEIVVNRVCPTTA